MKTEEIRNSLVNASKSLNRYLRQKDCFEYKAGEMILCGNGIGNAIAYSGSQLSAQLGCRIEYREVSQLLKDNGGKKIVYFPDGEVPEYIRQLDPEVINYAEGNNRIEDFARGLVAVRNVVLAAVLNQKALTGLQVGEFVKGMREYLDQFDQPKLNELAKQCEAAVEKIGKGIDVDYIGEGNQKPLIEFAQIFNAENFGVISSYENSEDWHHINVFMRNSDKIYTPIVVNSTSPSIIRLKETVTVADAISRRMAVITDSDLETASPVIKMPKAFDDWSNVLIDLYVFSYLSALMSERAGA